ncbi:MAG: hypothetical protein L0Y72_28075 [Gemmataceae bacterium]|nr:hypothetical protein [Gemmataceae bacterium]
MASHATSTAALSNWIPIASGSGKIATTEERFRRLKAQWLGGIGPSSSLTDMLLHPAYQQIIGMGTPVVPVLLHELEREPNHWFWALMSITGENPASHIESGNVDETVQAWLQWGRDRGVS